MNSDGPRVTVPVLLDVSPETWRRIEQLARVYRDGQGGATDPETVFADALTEYVEMDPVVVDGEVRDVSDVFPEADTDTDGDADTEPEGDA